MFTDCFSFFCVFLFEACAELSSSLVIVLDCTDSSSPPDDLRCKPIDSRFLSNFTAP